MDSNPGPDHDRPGVGESVRGHGEGMIVAIYTHVTPRKERERLAEYLK